MCTSSRAVRMGPIAHCMPNLRAYFAPGEAPYGRQKDMGRNLVAVQHADRAEAFIDLNRFSEALDEALIATNVEPNSAKAWLALSAAQLGMKHHKAALSASKRAAVLDPGNSKAALLEGIAQEELKRTQQQKYKTGCA